MSPTKKRAAIIHTQKQLKVSQRRICSVIEQPRSTQRYKLKQPSKDVALSKRLHELSRRYPRYGYRRVCHILIREGWHVNIKRIHRLWRKEGLQVRQKKYRKRALGNSENACSKHQLDN